jgi:tetratricopeptide (TPR) repeat protein
MRDLGLLEQENGDLDQARHWFTEAIATEHPDQAPKAMVNLGALEQEHGDLDQARHWYIQAIAAGHPDQTPHAMVNLGLLEEQQGRADDARGWYIAAVATGHPEHAQQAAGRLGPAPGPRGRVQWVRRDSGRAGAEPSRWEQKQNAEDHRRAQHFGRFGWQAHADPELLNPAATPDQDNSAG